MCSCAAVVQAVRAGEGELDHAAQGRGRGKRGPLGQVTGDDGMQAVKGLLPGAVAHTICRALRIGRPVGRGGSAHRGRGVTFDETVPGPVETRRPVQGIQVERDGLVAGIRINQLALRRSAKAGEKHHLALVCS